MTPVLDTKTYSHVTSSKFKESLRHCMRRPGFSAIDQDVVAICFHGLGGHLWVQKGSKLLLLKTGENQPTEDEIGKVPIGESRDKLLLAGCTVRL